MNQFLSHDLQTTMAEFIQHMKLKPSKGHSIWLGKVHESHNEIGRT